VGPRKQGSGGLLHIHGRSRTGTTAGEPAGGTSLLSLSPLESIRFQSEHSHRLLAEWLTESLSKSLTGIGRNGVNQWV
jgi:hypothetical protein